ncbi:hypothetical protein C0992_006935 [Termitomyces sp. T32_za158]|nr:hypothetical protein C0992_006935 [Termitomyces sp. T32_za158]
MSHWLHFEPTHRRTSGHHIRYKDWYGANVGISEVDEARFGEAGYFMEGELWGGIIEYAFPFVGLKGVKGLYQMPNGNTLRAFDSIGLVVRHPGDVKDKKREQISLEAMTKRLTPGTTMEVFADNELVPLYAIKRDAKDMWTTNDPAPQTDTDGEGRRRSSHPRLHNGDARSRFAIPYSDDVLYATAEFASNTAQSVTYEE